MMDSRIYILQKRWKAGQLQHTAATKAGCSVLLLVGKSLCSFRQSGSHCHQSQQEWCGIGSVAVWAQLQGWVQRLAPWFWFIISLAAKSKATFPFVLFSSVKIPGPDFSVLLLGWGFECIWGSSPQLCPPARAGVMCLQAPPLPTSSVCAPCGGGDQTWQSGFLNFSLPGWFRKEKLEVPGGWRKGKAQVSPSSSLWG